MADHLPAAHMYPPTKLTVLISGNGSNLQALIDACASSLLPSTRIVRVISNKKMAYGLQRATHAGIPTAYHNLVAGKYHASGEKDASVKDAARERYDADLASLVLADSPDLVVCAGFMHVLKPTFLDPLVAANVPVINLHPALPDAYDGINAIKRAYDDFVAGKLENGRTGIMVHLVTGQVDKGRPILIREVECRQGETYEELEERMHKTEHEVIVAGTRLAITSLLAKE